jgi:hypothetical protein
MQTLVAVYVSADTATKLEKLALIGGSVGQVIERLLAHWQSTGYAPDRVPSSATAPRQAMWKTPNGDLLPVGEPLVATYKGKEFSAEIESSGLRFQGRLYPNPTAAGRAVKHTLGVTGPAASTDGRTFWKLLDPSTGRYVSIAQLNPGEPIDTAKILAELKAKGAKSPA